MTFHPNQRIRTNAAYLAAGGPRARRKPFGAVVVAVRDGEVKIVKDGTKSAEWVKDCWFEVEKDGNGEG